MHNYADFVPFLEKSLVPFLRKVAKMFLPYLHEKNFTNKKKKKMRFVSVTISFSLIIFILG